MQRTRAWRTPQAVIHHRDSLDVGDLAEVGVMGFLMGMVGALILGPLGLLVAGSVGAGVGVVVSLLAGWFIAARIADFEVPRFWRPAVGEHRYRFNQVDRSLLDLRARVEENPELVVRVGRLVLESRKALVGACVDVAKRGAEARLGTRGVREVHERIDAELTRTQRVLTDAHATLDKEREVSRLPGANRFILERLDGARLDELRSELKVRREVLEDIKDM